jgi:hypothetical protein
MSTKRTAEDGSDEIPAADDPIQAGNDVLGSNGRVSSSDSNWGNKINSGSGFVGWMQQLVIDGREPFEMDGDDDINRTGSGNDDEDGTYDSTADVDATGNPVTISSSDAYVLVRNSKNGVKHKLQQSSGTFSVYVKVSQNNVNIQR